MASIVPYIVDRPRRHKMVRVAFENPFLRQYYDHDYLQQHQNHLDDIRQKLPGWSDDATASDPHRPQAVVFDIDEVILCNIHMNFLPRDRLEADADWHAATIHNWPRGHWGNPLLPGALLLLKELRARDIQIFFITGRLESIREETVENFKLVGIAHDEPGRALFTTAELQRKDGPDVRIYHCPDDAYPGHRGISCRKYKEPIRAKIAETYHIIANIGDQVSDLGYHGDYQCLTPHPFYFTP